MFYPGWLAAYFLASLLSNVLGIPYPVAFVLILLTWVYRDRIHLGGLGHFFSGSSALSQAQREAAVNPANADAQSQAGTILVERRRYAEAVPYLRAALGRMERSAEIHALLGTALLRCEGPEPAESHLRRAIELDPRFRQGEAHLRLAEALVASGRASEGHELLRACFGDATTDIEALVNIGEAARAAGHEEEAHAAFLAAKQAWRTNPPFRHRRDRPWAIRARRALGERVIADKLALAGILALGLAVYLWRALG